MYTTFKDMKAEDAQAIYNRYSSKISDPASIVFSAQEGVSAKIFEDVVKLFGHSDYMTEVVDLTRKTIKKYHKEDMKFSPSRSEIMLKMISLYQSGISVFGDRDAFMNWLTKPAYGINGKIPFNLIKTSDGIDLIMEELDRIRYGDTA